MSAASPPDETARELNLDELRQMCDAPSDGYSAGEWCEAANRLLALVERQAADLERLRRIEEAARDFMACGPDYGGQFSGERFDVYRARFDTAISELRAALAAVGAGEAGALETHE